MWIRSQNKYTLINTNIIRICEDDRDDFGDYLICGYTDGYDHELGVYSTLEKALKVLHQIQHAISDNVIINGKTFGPPCGTNRQQTIMNKRDAVYLMPLDEDVKV